MKFYVENWTIENETGYKPITTLYQDFSIADRFGIKAIKETYNRVFKEFKNNYKYITELVMVLNWKLWRYYENNEELARLYNDLYIKLDNWCCENLKGEELQYYYNTTD